MAHLHPCQLRHSYPRRAPPVFGCLGYLGFPHRSSRIASHRHLPRASAAQDSCRNAQSTAVSDPPIPCFTLRTFVPSARQHGRPPAHLDITVGDGTNGALSPRARSSRWSCAGHCSQRRSALPLAPALPRLALPVSMRSPRSVSFCCINLTFSSSSSLSRCNLAAFSPLFSCALASASISSVLTNVACCVAMAWVRVVGPGGGPTLNKQRAECSADLRMGIFITTASLGGKEPEK